MSPTTNLSSMPKWERNWICKGRAFDIPTVCRELDQRQHSAGESIEPADAPAEVVRIDPVVPMTGCQQALLWLALGGAGVLFWELVAAAVLVVIGR
jgi:hypothetical protein